MIKNCEALIHHELKMVKELVYDKWGMEITNLKISLESTEYGACSFLLNGKSIQQRISKITPTKTGQFVTIWKRNASGITVPYDILDDLDFIIILSRDGENFGQFIFPKNVLADKGIITQPNKEGKRGIRVYPPWDMVTNKQAKKTQLWQRNYFLTINDDKVINNDLVKKLLIL